MGVQNSYRRIWLLLTVLLLLFIVISYFFLSKGPKQYPNYVSESPSPTGIKAFYTYLQQEKEANRWSNSPQLLMNMGEGKTLIIVEPFFTPNETEMRAYVDFMEAGNSIILFQKNPKGMFDLKTEMIDLTKPVYHVTDRNKNGYRAIVNSPIRLAANTDNEILFEDTKGIIALKKTFGNGQLIVSITPEWMINSKITDDDHLSLILSFMNETHSQAFLIDEYTHLGQNAPTVMKLYPEWFLLMLIQGSILIILLLWYKGKRFGAIITPREETVRFSDEGIKALAAWNIRGRNYRESLNIQADYLKLLMQERWGTTLHISWIDMANKLEQKLKGNAALEVKPLINGLEHVLEKDKINKQEYLLWSKRLNRLKKEVEEG